MSAYNAITGFSFNEKLECGTNTTQAYPDVFVHDAAWVPTAVHIQRKLTIKILGVPVDLTNGWTDLKKYVAKIISTALLPLQRKNVSPATKLITFRTAILPAILYPAKFLDLTNAEYLKLFSPLDAWLRLATGFQRTIHRQQLYGTGKQAGMGITDIVLQIQKFKARMIHRALDPKSPVRNSGLAIIERCYRQAVRCSSSEPLSYDVDIKSWLGSLLEQHSISHMHVASQFTPGWYPIAEFAAPEHREYVAQTAALTDIETIRDLTYLPTEGAPRQLLDHPLTKYLLISELPPCMTHYVSIGKLYLFDDHRIREFLGVYNSRLLWREWLRTTQLDYYENLTSRQRMEYHPKYPVLGTRISPSLRHGVDYTPHAYLLGVRCRIHCEYTQNSKGLIAQSHIAMIIPDCAPELHPSSILRSMRKCIIQANQFYVTEEHRVLEVTEVTPQAVTVRPWTEIVLPGQGRSHQHITEGSETYSSSVRSLRIRSATTYDPIKPSDGPRTTVIRGVRPIILSDNLSGREFPRTSNAVFTDGGFQEQPLQKDLLFNTQQSYPKHLTGGAIILDSTTQKASETICIEIPTGLVPFPAAYDSEALTVLATLMTVDKTKLEGSTFYLDCQALVNELSKSPDSDNFPEDPLINTIRQMFLERHIIVTWVLTSS